MGTVLDLSAEDLAARRTDLLARVSMTWEQMQELADAYALDASERNIYDTIRAIDYLLGQSDE